MARLTKEEKLKNIVQKQADLEMQKKKWQAEINKKKKRKNKTINRKEKEMLYKEFIEKTGFDEKYVTFDDYNKYIESIYMDSKLDQKEFCKMFYDKFTEFVSNPTSRYISRLSKEEKECSINNNDDGKVFIQIDLFNNIVKQNFIENMYLHGDKLLVKQTETLFINKDFEKIPFRKSNLKDYMFINCNFNNCNMENVNLEGASFICCDLNNTNLSKSNMEKSYFVHSDLNNANLYKAWLVNAMFVNVNMENANVEEVVTEAITLNSNYAPSKKSKFYMRNVNYKNTLFEYVYDKKNSLLEKAPTTSKEKEYER